MVKDSITRIYARIIMRENETETEIELELTKLPEEYRQPVKDYITISKSMIK